MPRMEIHCRGNAAAMQMPRPAALAQRTCVLILAAAVPLSGCTDLGDRQASASEVATRLLTAVGDKDGASACAVLAPETAADLEQSAGKPCAQAVLEEDLPAPGAVAGADVYGQWAQVRLTDDTVFPGGWRVVAAGCAPRQSRPYDCAVQGG
jgi:hypothetical protein